MMRLPTDLGKAFGQNAKAIPQVQV